MNIGDPYKQHHCGGTLKVINEWTAAWILQCTKCYAFAIKFKDEATNDPKDAYDKNLINPKQKESE